MILATHYKCTTNVAQCHDEHNRKKCVLYVYLETPAPAAERWQGRCQSQWYGRGHWGSRRPWWNSHPECSPPIAPTAGPHTANVAASESGARKILNSGCCRQHLDRDRKVYTLEKEKPQNSTGNMSKENEQTVVFCLLVDHANCLRLILRWDAQHAFIIAIIIIKTKNPTRAQLFILPFFLHVF